MPAKKNKKLTDLPKKQVNAKKAETIKGGYKQTPSSGSTFTTLKSPSVS
jgi:hypothetical protein